jgi:hypothetical protein
VVARLHPVTPDRDIDPLHRLHALQPYNPSRAGLRRSRDLLRRSRTYRLCGGRNDDIEQRYTSTRARHGVPQHHEAAPSIHLRSRTICVVPEESIDCIRQQSVALRSGRRDTNVRGACNGIHGATAESVVWMGLEQ